jgi:hypothetical protein
VYCIRLAQNRIQWWGLVTTVINPPSSIQGGEFLDKPSDYQLFKKDFV